MGAFRMRFAYDPLGL